MSDDEKKPWVEEYKQAMEEYEKNKKKEYVCRVSIVSDALLTMK